MLSYSNQILESCDNLSAIIDIHMAMYPFVSAKNRTVKYIKWFTTS